MFHLSTNIGNIETRNLTELVIALVSNIFGNDRVGIRSLVDILLDVFQERSTVLATHIGKYDLFLDLSRDMVPLRCRVFIVRGQRRPIELFLNHFDNTDSNRYGPRDDRGCHGFYLRTRESKIHDTDQRYRDIRADIHSCRPLAVSGIRLTMHPCKALGLVTPVG